MRSHVAVMCLLLAACGGGSDTTAPATFFRVNVTGEGSGSGRIHATQGSAFDCPVGSGNNGCGSISVEKGTELRFEAAADVASGFRTWGSDASSCGTATTCSITVDRDLTLLARFELEAEGSWSGPVHDNSSAAVGTLSLTLSETNGVVTGSGSLNSASNAIAVTASGTYTPPNLSLTMSAPGFSDLNLTATVGKTSMTGTLNGSGFINSSVTLNRQ